MKKYQYYIVMCIVISGTTTHAMVRNMLDWFSGGIGYVRKRTNPQQYVVDTKTFTRAADALCFHPLSNEGSTPSYPTEEHAPSYDQWVKEVTDRAGFAQIPIYRAISTDDINRLRNILKTTHRSWFPETTVGVIVSYLARKEKEGVLKTERYKRIVTRLTTPPAEFSLDKMLRVYLSLKRGKAELLSDNEYNAILNVLQPSQTSLPRELQEAMDLLHIAKAENIDLPSLKILIQNHKQPHQSGHDEDVPSPHLSKLHTPLSVSSSGSPIISHNPLVPLQQPAPSTPSQPSSDHPQEKASF